MLAATIIGCAAPGTVQTVAAVTGLSASTIFRKLAADPPQFCAPIRLGKRCTRWKSACVRAWLAAQVAG